MSRFYEMLLEIKGYNRTNQTEIINACTNQWGFGADSFNDVHNGILHTWARDSLCSGETEEDFAHRIAQAVWKANHGYCQVAILATYLEELPYEEHVRNEDDYNKWKSSFGGD